jgi:hypothetical protein
MAVMPSTVIERLLPPGDLHDNKAELMQAFRWNKPPVWQRDVITPTIAGHSATANVAWPVERDNTGDVLMRRRRRFVKEYWPMTVFATRWRTPAFEADRPEGVRLQTLARVGIKGHRGRRPGIPELLLDVHRLADEHRGVEHQESRG